MQNKKGRCTDTTKASSGNGTNLCSTVEPGVPHPVVVYLELVHTIDIRQLEVGAEDTT